MLLFSNEIFYHLPLKIVVRIQISKELVDTK